LPQFNELSREDAIALLQRNDVGRIAYAHRQTIEIVPIHYVADGDWIFGRTSLSEKLEHLAHNSWVAFETDEVTDLFDWKSVVVHGGFYVFAPDGPASDFEHRARAIDALRRLLPETATETDPVPFRTVFFGIAIQHISGRCASDS
jgi:nitroimidazol reductase NimA-like FMN-containing flavoprotein (pyridoxamine 5'-phosphate oxidase superfamily)